MQTAHIPFLDLLNGTVQYVVPRWQRRYRWGQTDIQRLVDDLLAVAATESPTAHYGGALLTFPEPGPEGVVKRVRVVDGQQRLTTVSIILACIAEQLGQDGHCGDWNRQTILDDRLTNPGKSEDKFRKLRLQQGDDEEYRRVLESRPKGSGAVTQAWKIVRRLVARNDVAKLLEGLGRFRVVSISLDPHEDPQQIFESINATGRPLAESEKVKNWLLMGQPEAEQRDLHDNYWLKLEQQLGAKHTTEPIDVFLRDVLRWRTGELRGKDQAYEGLRRWALGEHGASLSARASVCRELARLARLYGILTGSAGHHLDRGVETELRHLRALGVHVHRPLSLRLLDDASRGAPAPTHSELAKVFHGLGTWLTRMWLADRPPAGLNKAAAELANLKGPGPDEDYVDYWLGQIRRRQNTRVGVPNDDDVARGMRARKAHGGSATRSSTAVLSALMEAEHGEEAPAREHLTIEHVMPQKLTSAWEDALGDEAAEIHEQWLHRFANLTLSGDVTNARLGTGTFEEKRSIYENSSIGLTREIAEEEEWGREALERRAKALADRALRFWPWQDSAGPEAPSSETSGTLEWRLDEGPWRSEESASQMVLNVAGNLLDQNPGNAEKLAGDTLSRDLQPARLYPPGSKAGALKMRGVTGHGAWVLYPYDSTAETANRCRSMGKRCGVDIEVRGMTEIHWRSKFYEFLRQRTGGLPGQTNGWRGKVQWTEPLNSHGDRVGLGVYDDSLSLWIRKPWGPQGASADLQTRLRRYSARIRSGMADQRIKGDSHAESLEGRTVWLTKPWAHEDDEDWPAAADWIKDQYERLRIILTDLEDDSEPE